jgi:hypothetical protein
VHDAFPVLVLTVTAPQPLKVVALSVKPMVPPSGVGDTVAVYVTLPPVVDGLDDETVVVVVPPAFTCSVIGPPLEAAKLASPL